MKLSYVVAVLLILIVGSFFLFISPKKVADTLIVQEWHEKEQFANIQLRTVRLLFCVHENAVPYVVVQLRYLRQKFLASHPEIRAEIEICHVGELSKSTAHYLRSQGLEVIDLGPEASTLGDPDFFRGFHCKPLCLAVRGNRGDHVIMLDLDTVIVSDPFPVLFSKHSPYLKTGLLLFRDQVTVADWSKRFSGFLKACDELVRGLGQEQEANRLQSLLYSIPNVNETYHVGESAMVFLQPSRQLKTLHVLHQLLTKEWRSVWEPHMHGDKELYWLAALIANKELPFFSPYGFQPIVDQSFFIESLDYSFVQYMPFGDERVLYINGVKSLFARGRLDIFRLGRRKKGYRHKPDMTFEETALASADVKKAVGLYSLLLQQIWKSGLITK